MSTVMTASNENLNTSAAAIEQAKALIASAQAVVDQSLSAIKKKCQGENGRLSSSALDDHQLVSYELAYAAAELSGAGFVVDYAERVAAETGVALDSLI